MSGTAEDVVPATVPAAAPSAQGNRELREPLRTAEAEAAPGIQGGECKKRCLHMFSCAKSNRCCVATTILLIIAALIAVIAAGCSGSGGAPNPGPLKCDIQACAEVHVPEGAKDCKSVTCNRCQDGFEPLLDPQTLEPSRAVCIFPCTLEQKAAGCMASSCAANGSCSACVPGFEPHSSEGSLRGSPMTCAKATEPVKMNFFMYRAQSDEDYPPGNTVLASPGGVMWYLHNEVVNKCPRKLKITRVLRYNVTVFNPLPVYSAVKGQFGHFVQFDAGKCSVPDCDSEWQKYGYAVGCQKQLGVYRYKGSDFYSLPGQCPSHHVLDKSETCRLQQPGGMCSSPDGTNNCTWHAGQAGEVSVNELSGIDDIDAFCAAGNREYDPLTDKGHGTDFWDDRLNETRNDQRVLKLLRLFAEHHPIEAKDAMLMSSPLCDGF